MITCIIVEDELPAREELKFFINKETAIELKEEFDNPIDVLTFLEENSVDVIFLDINMPNMNGLSLSKIVKKMAPKTKIVFITAYKEYAIDAFEIKAFDYLLKPYSENRIKNLLKSLINFEENKKSESKKLLKKLILNGNGKLQIISLEDIDFIEAYEKETFIFCKNTKYISKTKISEWEKTLVNENFFRCHRSYIINLNKVIEIEPWINSSWTVKIKNYNNLIPVSRNQIKKLKSLFLLNS